MVPAQTPRLSLFGYLLGMTEIEAAPIWIPSWYDLRTPVAVLGLLTPAFEAPCWKSLHTPNPPSVAWRFLECYWALSYLFYLSW
jgi:hypothetical protein